MTKSLKLRPAAPDDPIYKLGYVVGGSVVFKRREDLYYREARGSLVFAGRSTAEHVHRIHEALRSAETWGAFKAALPAGEWDDIAERYRAADEDEDLPADDAPFSSADVPGVCDGDYPVWLQAEIDLVLPEDLLHRFAKRENSVLNGPFFTIDPEHEDALVRELRSRGYTVTRRDDLRFW
ncbi:MAG: hypothetical protein IPM60_01960 [Rhodospirillales bacterium]|nr:hypothetical protein [Rhodospirillales bacterium]